MVLYKELKCRIILTLMKAVTHYIIQFATFYRNYLVMANVLNFYKTVPRETTATKKFTGIFDIYISFIKQITIRAGMLFQNNINIINFSSVTFDSRKKFILN